jgi:hypothetical protein
MAQAAFARSAIQRSISLRNQPLHPGDNCRFLGKRPARSSPIYARAKYRGKAWMPLFAF